MSSALKPALPGGQSPPGPTPLVKPILPPQATAQLYTHATPSTTTTTHTNHYTPTGPSPTVPASTPPPVTGPAPAPPPTLDSYPAYKFPSENAVSSTPSIQEGTVVTTPEKPKMESPPRKMYAGPRAPGALRVEKITSSPPNEDDEKSRKETMRIPSEIDKPQSNGTGELSPSKGESPPRKIAPTPPRPPAKTNATPERILAVENNLEEKKKQESPVQAPGEGGGSTTAVTDVEEKTEESSSETSITPPKGQKTTLKLATYRTPTRKLKTIKPDETQKSPKGSERTIIQKSPNQSKSKRVRTKTQLYQSPLPEVELISKITAPIPKNRNNEEKLIIFYKNEFLAVRNSEGGFYVCQAMQNVYKSSPRIKIRWLSQEKSDKSIYSPDFYDYTDFDCILTNLNLTRLNRVTFRLPPSEKERTDSILKRALAVENGDATPPSLSEEHPDDLSLYKEEGQLKTRKGKKRKQSPLKRTTQTTPTLPSPDQEKVRKVTTRRGKGKKRVARVPQPSTSKVERTTRKHEIKTSPVVDHKKARVLAKVVRKKGVAKLVTKGRKIPTPTTPTKVKPSTSKAGSGARKSRRTKK